MKKCCHCKTEKPLTDFYLSKSQKDGYSRQCRICHAGYQRKWYLKKMGRLSEEPPKPIPSTKECTTCGENLPLEGFHRHRQHIDGRQTRCKVCQNRDGRKLYRKYRERRELERLTRYEANKQSLIQYKKDRGGCSRCPETNPICLDMHHRDPKTKKFNISSGMSYAHKLFFKEMEKCDVLCANCHRKLHAEEH